MSKLDITLDMSVYIKFIIIIEESMATSRSLRKRHFELASGVI